MKREKQERPEPEERLKQRWQEIENECQCQISTKIRVKCDLLTNCERCQKNISAAEKKRVIKNRHDPRFWGLEIKEKILCFQCLKAHYIDMPQGKKHTFRKYLKRYATKEAEQHLRINKSWEEKELEYAKEEKERVLRLRILKQQLDEELRKKGIYTRFYADIKKKVRKSK